MTTDATPSPASPAPRAAWLATVGVAVTIAGPVAHFALLSLPWQRSSGALAWGIMGVGVVLAFLAARRDRRLRTRVLAGASLIVAALFSVGFFVLFRLPPAQQALVLDRAPDFTLPDHTGAPVSFKDARAAGPILLVFYRGYW